MTAITIGPQRRTILALALAGTAALSFALGGRTAPARTADIAQPPAASPPACTASVPRQYLAHYYPSGYSYSRNAWGQDASPDAPAVTSTSPETTSGAAGRTP